MSTCFHAAAADRSYYYYYYTTRHRHHYHYNKKSSTTSFNHHVKSSNYKPLSSSYPPLTLDEQIHESSIARIKSEQRIFGPRSQSPVVCIPRHHMHDNDKLQKHRSTNERLSRGIGAVPFVGNYSWSCESRATRHVHDPLETVTRFELWDDLLNNRYKGIALYAYLYDIYSSSHVRYHMYVDPPSKIMPTIAIMRCLLFQRHLQPTCHNAP